MASVEELSQIKGIGPTKAQIIKAALELGARLNAEAMPRKQKVRTPQDVMRLLGGKAQKLEREIFWALLLDNKNVLKCRPVDVSVGLLNVSLAHPREVFVEAIRTTSAAIVLAHNHPSGDPTPSAEDIRITKQLVEAGKIVDIKVLDHVVIGKRDSSNSDRYVSMREEGLIEFR
jgi:DNA repair protein RadC